MEKCEYCIPSFPKYNTLFLVPNVDDIYGCVLYIGRGNVNLRTIIQRAGGRGRVDCRLQCRGFLSRRQQGEVAWPVVHSVGASRYVNLRTHDQRAGGGGVACRS